MNHQEEKGPNLQGRSESVKDCTGLPYQWAIACISCEPNSWYQWMDSDSLPVCRDITDRKQFVAWGPATPTSYLTESTSFPNEAIREPVVKRTW